jgi:phosphatidylglycerophosphatase A
MTYFYAWAKIPDPTARLTVAGLVLAFSVWAASRCERFFNEKDPSSVVIDEIASLPIAFWPLLHAHEPRWWVWLAAFGLYRAADVVKPWPARRFEELEGGTGIVADDVAAGAYAGLILLGWEHFAAARN